MTEAEVFNAIRKGLEYWTLINLTDLSIILSFIALLMLVGRHYLSELEGHLNLRVTLEVWRLVTDLGVDLSLLIAVGIGFLIINPDIFADIKVALPFFPAATLLLSAALVLRVFHGGRRKGAASTLAMVLITAGALVHAIGYTFVMEAAPAGWLADHPSTFWTTLRSWRSNENPELSMTVFWIFGPLLYGVLIWAVTSGIRRLSHTTQAKE